MSEPDTEAPLDWQELVTIGRCLKPHGIRGEIKVAVITDFPERFEQMETVFLHRRKNPVIEMRLERCRFHKKAVLLQLEGVTTVEQAEEWRDYQVAAHPDELVDLEEDEYWHFELEGLDVVDPEGQPLGRLREVVFNPGNDIYVVENEGRELLIPAVKDYVLEIDLEAGRITVKVPEYEEDTP